MTKNNPCFISQTAKIRPFTNLFFIDTIFTLYTKKWLRGNTAEYVSCVALSSPLFLVKNSFSTRAKHEVTVEGGVPVGPKRENVMLGSPAASTTLTAFLSVGPSRSSCSTPSTLLHWSPETAHSHLIIHHSVILVRRQVDLITHYGEI